MNPPGMEMTEEIAAKLAMPFFTEWQAMHPQAAENNLKRFIKLVSGALEVERDRALAEIARLTAELANVRKLGNLSNALWREAEAEVVTLIEPVEHDDMLCFTRGAVARMTQEKTDMEGEIAHLTAALADIAKTRLAELDLREAAAREEEREVWQRDIQAMREQYAPLEEGEAVMLDTLQDRVQRRDAIRARITL